MRENGFYWVKYRGNWQIAQYSNSIINTFRINCWWLIGDEKCYLDFPFEEIDETRLVRGK
jgi:hypothetical protein